MTEDNRYLPSDIPRCSLCYTGLSLVAIGKYNVCGNCYDHYLIRKAIELGAEEMLKADLELWQATKEWKDFLNE